MVFAILIFLIGNILCGSAQDMNWLITARVVQGPGWGWRIPLVGICHHQRHYDFEGPSKVPRYGSARVGLRDEYWSKLV